MLDLLRMQYGEIVIPEAVFREISGKNDAVKKQITSSEWIHIEPVMETKSKRMYRAKLHEGEVEVVLV